MRWSRLGTQRCVLRVCLCLLARSPELQAGRRVYADRSLWSAGDNAQRLIPLTRLPLSGGSQCGQASSSQPHPVPFVLFPSVARRSDYSASARCRPVSDDVCAWPLS